MYLKKKNTTKLIENRLEVLEKRKKEKDLQISISLQSYIIYNTLKKWVLRFLLVSYNL